MRNIKLFETISAYTEARESEYIEPWVSYTRENERVVYNKSEYEKLLETPLTLKVLNDGTFGTKDGEGGDWFYPQFSLYYKINDGDWTLYSADTIYYTGVSVSSGDTIQLKGNNSEKPWELRLDVSGGFNVLGNLMSLIDGENFSTLNEVPGGFFSCIFQYTLLYDASKLVLPATTLAENCYSNMFYSCASLTTAPLILPATTLAESCYSSMFYGCTSLTSTPALPATTLAESCYSSMFYGCTSLTSAPSLPATALTGSCYGYMFAGCTGLTQAPELPATTLVGYCYYQMFQGCTSLTTAPELPATTLATNCYRAMFSGCTNLNYIKCLATNISASSSHQNWVSGVQTTSGTFVKAASMSSWPSGVDGIPANWTVQDAS